MIRAPAASLFAYGTTGRLIQVTVLVLVYVLVWSSTPQHYQLVLAGDFNTDVVYLFGEQRVKFSKDGREVDLSLDKYMGSGFKSKNKFIFGKFDMLIKAVPGYSAGTVTAFYLNTTSEDGRVHEEIDFEFMGNINSKDIVLQTNVITHGYGRSREQRFRLWFDPAADYHRYTILWNPTLIIFYVDGTPIRVYKPGKPGGEYPSQNPMEMTVTIWDGSSWATGGGRIKIDWSKAPFNASFRDYNGDGCISTSTSASTSSCSSTSSSWMNITTLNPKEMEMLQNIRKKFMTYNYCTDPSYQHPPECSVDDADLL